MSGERVGVGNEGYPRRLPPVSLKTIEGVLQNASQNPEDFISSIRRVAKSEDPYSGLLSWRLSPAELLEPRNAVVWMGRAEWSFFDLLGKSLVWSAVYQESRTQQLAFPASLDPELTDEDTIALGRTMIDRIQKTVTNVEEEWENNPISKLREGLIKEELEESSQIIPRGLPLALLALDGFEISDYWLQMVRDLRNGVTSWKKRFDQVCRYGLYEIDPEEIWGLEAIESHKTFMDETSQSKEPIPVDEQEDREEGQETIADSLFDKDLGKQLRAAEKARHLNTFSELSNTNVFLGSLVCLGWEAVQAALEEPEFTGPSQEDREEFELRFLRGVTQQWREFQEAA